MTARRAAGDPGRPASGGGPGGDTARRDEPLVHVEDLWHTYMQGTPFAQTALRGVTMEIRAGEVVGIIGHTGSGKSTLMQYLNGLLRPARGRVRVAGHDLARPDVDIAAVRRFVGVVFQDPEDQVFEPLVGDDVAYGPRQLGLAPAELRERVRWGMDAVGLPFEAFKDRYTYTLSGGELRKAALAGVLAMRPRVLVLDEPTSGLDPGARGDLRERLQALRARDGLTLVLVSHDMDEVARISDRVYVLHAGAVVASGPPRDVFTRADALAPYGLMPPHATQVCGRLRARGVPVRVDALTIEEAGDAIAALLRGTR
ncbi:MAG TPA: energy-coupling factor transporter ATPase [bacterium]|nr:energy-coupling factor transporter ATPase [bacterium]